MSDLNTVGLYALMGKINQKQFRCDRQRVAFGRLALNIGDVMFSVAIQPARFLQHLDGIHLASLPER